MQHRQTRIATAALMGAFSLSLPAIGAPTTLFVAADAQGTHCTVGAPCAHIQQAIDQAQAGDQILIANGQYVENLNIPVEKSGLHLYGQSRTATVVISDGGDRHPTFAPANVPADIIIDIFAPRVSIDNLSLRHPKAIPDKRDIGVFVRPSANDANLHNLLIERRRKGAVLEPTRPGSRGILVFRAQGTQI